MDYSYDYYKGKYTGFLQVYREFLISEPEFISLVERLNQESKYQFEIDLNRTKEND